MSSEPKAGESFPAGITPRLSKGPLKSQLGDGVPRLPEAPKKEAEVPEFREEQVPKGDSVWSDKPTFTDQFINQKYLNTWRQCPEHIVQFDLTNPEDQKKLDDLMKRTLPPGAPEIVIVDRDRQFHAGVFFVCISYKQLQYKRLVSTS